MVQAQRIAQSVQASLDEAFFYSPETFVHPTAQIGPEVVLEAGVKVGAYTTIAGRVRLGKNTRIYPYVSIGLPAEVLGQSVPKGEVIIGSDCAIREFASIHSSRYAEGKTVIGNNCYLMNYVHVSHDCVVEDNVTMINSVQLGGHTHLEQNVFMMASAATHQFCRVGKFAAVAPFSAARQDLPPFGMYNTQPAAFHGLNVVGLRRSGFSSETIRAIKKVAGLFYQDKLLLADLEAAVAADESLASQQAVKDFVDFIKNSSRGVSRRIFKNTTASEEE